MLCILTWKSFWLCFREGFEGSCKEYKRTNIRAGSWVQPFITCTFRCVACFRLRVRVARWYSLRPLQLETALKETLGTLVESVVADAIGSASRDDPCLGCPMASVERGTIIEARCTFPAYFDRCTRSPHSAGYGDTVGQAMRSDDAWCLWSDASFFMCSLKRGRERESFFGAIGKLCS